MMPSHWFFINRKQLPSEENLEPVARQRAFTSPSTPTTKQGTEGENEEDEDRKQNSLSKIISKHFSATRDIRAFNINSPQSQ